MHVFGGTFLQHPLYVSQSFQITGLFLLQRLYYYMMFHTYYFHNDLRCSQRYTCSEMMNSLELYRRHASRENCCTDQLEMTENNNEKKYQHQQKTGDSNTEMQFLITTILYCKDKHRKIRFTKCIFCDRKNSIHTNTTGRPRPTLTTRTHVRV